MDSPLLDNLSQSTSCLFATSKVKSQVQIQVQDPRHHRISKVVCCLIRIFETVSANIVCVSRFSFLSLSLFLCYSYELRIDWLDRSLLDLVLESELESSKKYGLHYTTTTPTTHLH